MLTPMTQPRAVRMLNMVSVSLSLSLALGASLLLSGCASTGQNRSQSAAHEVTTALQKGSPIVADVDNVVAALGTLQGGSGDTKAAHASLGKALGSLRTHANDFSGTVAGVHNAGDAYVSSWADSLETITDANIAASSRDRLDQLKAGIERLAIGEKDFNAVSTAFVKQVGDLQTALDFDLSPGGIASLRTSIATVIAAAPALKQQVATVEDRLRGLEDFMGAAPAPVAPTKKK